MKSKCTRSSRNKNLQKGAPSRCTATKLPFLLGVRVRVSLGPGSRPWVDNAVPGSIPKVGVIDKHVYLQKKNIESTLQPWMLSFCCRLRLAQSWSTSCHATYTK